MSAFDSELRRVAIHSAAASADLTLPAALPIAALIPSIIGILGIRAAETARRYHLSLPGAPALPSTTTLAQQGIRDGSVLVLSQSSPAPPVRHCDDVPEVVSATLEADDPERGGPTTRITLGIIATVFAALAGLFAVPGAAGAPRVLLAAAAATAVSVLAMRVTGCGEAILRAVACCAALVAVAALAGVLTTSPPTAIGSLATLACFGLLELSPRISIMLSGLSPRLSLVGDLDTSDHVASKAIRAGDWLTALHAAFSASATAGAIITVLTSPQWAAVGFGAIAGSLLLLRTRSIGVIATIGGMMVITTTFVAVEVKGLAPGQWVAAVAASLAVATMCLGFVAPTKAMSLSPVARRVVELLECLALVSLVPLTVWNCGAFTAIRDWA
ncbi:type VII secretion integral membrane protein EccD [Mycobacterium intermedium]|uniref:Type VII secretion integral membrane protein EccD n=1 Tax=Mycobacterium intermedium TaxID=28445 RepID=A0A1E3SL41_MYCIE|nr:type VII secretion integral membrane protein EccD [Mycobacterium intermedium]MCV6963502.1 type VII secretion integral membrane protein EccD [Mycobacterium intermedium]ODR02874.1 type VII secretion integral membrane protein EccD [Mycobacterium intermedium]OPE47099.1 type VII secretion integral membrane protein EccD [Mycobacterium intermedium]ORB09525.1 type VII secretion integral membrane protein EccD [Mycobacterium intermedium]